VNYREIGQKLRTSDKPVGIWLGSFFGTHRDWAGFEGIAMMCIDDRDLVEEMVRTTTDLLVHELAAALSEVEVDYAAGWEDICFRNGPIISPKMFSEIVIPQVKRVTSLLRQHGVTVAWTDCDGDITQLVPLWLEAGVNCMFPLEVHPGSDPVKFRKMFGKQLLLRGGLEKYQLAHGKKEIIEELKRVEKVVQEGGYIPHGDHRIPEDVPYENYIYYTREKLNMLGWKKDEIDRIEPLQPKRTSLTVKKPTAKKPAPSSRGKKSANRRR
jgi:uroporphyrinogen decarboxylase